MTNWKTCLTALYTTMFMIYVVVPLILTNTYGPRMRVKVARQRCPVFRSTPILKTPTGMLNNYGKNENLLKGNI